MTQVEFDRIPDYEWMLSRIPLRDALTARIPPGGAEFPKEKLPPGESRWYPLESGGLRLRVPYLGQSFDAEIFEIEPGGWDHTTCDVCVKRQPPMTLCYVTRVDPYIELCIQCYGNWVVYKGSNAI